MAAVPRVKDIPLRARVLDKVDSAFEQVPCVASVQVHTPQSKASKDCKK